jgi:hypothetical protein
VLGIDRDLDVVAHGDTGMCRHGSAVGIGQRDLVFPGVEMPRWFSPAAIWRSDDAPDARTPAMTSLRSAARSPAIMVRFARPCTRPLRSKA